MLDIKYLRENIDTVKEAVTNRQLDPKLVDAVIDLDAKRLSLVQQVEELRSQRNKITIVGGEPTQDQRDEGVRIKQELKELEPQLKEVGESFLQSLALIPNLPADDVPVGRDDEGNVQIKTWGEVPQFDFEPKDHLAIGEALGILDVVRAAKVSGARFGYFKGAGALLDLGLMWYTFNKLSAEGFTPVIPPVIIKKEIEWGLGYTEDGGWDQEYVFEEDGMAFVGSSEHSVIPMYKDEVLLSDQLPLRYVNYSTCFRREAGSYGKDTRGLFRVHQFNKVEMNVYTQPDLAVSDAECLHLLSLQEEIVQDLGLPYRVVAACTGDLPRPNRRMYDIECYFPSQGRYRETHSCSNCSDYQTRRLNIRVKGTGENSFAHALNATAITERAVLAILENFQQKDGSVVVPEVLRPFVGQEIIQPKV